MRCRVALHLLRVLLSFAFGDRQCISSQRYISWHGWNIERSGCVFPAPSYGSYLRAVRSPLVRTGVLLMLCGLGMNALVTDTNAGSMPVIGMPPTLRPASPMWQGATLQTRLPLLADQARLGMFSIGDIVLLFGGMLIVAICVRRTLARRRSSSPQLTTHPNLPPSTI